MHRTQIYLQDELYESLKARSGALGLSISELIRRAVEKDAQRQPVAEARAFFSQLKPLASLEGVEPEAHVRGLRSNSRLLRKPTKK